MFDTFLGRLLGGWKRWWCCSAGHNTDRTHLCSAHWRIGLLAVRTFRHSLPAKVNTVNTYGIDKKREKARGKGRKGKKEDEETDWNHMERTRRRRRLLHLCKLIKGQHIAPLCFMAIAKRCLCVRWPTLARCLTDSVNLKRKRVADAEERLTKSKEWLPRVVSALAMSERQCLCLCKLANYRFAHRFGRVCTIFLPYISAKSTNKHWMCKIKR